MSEYKLTDDYYYREQRDPERIRGTTIGKKGVNDFVKGLIIRMRGKMSLHDWDKIDPEEKIAIAYEYFFKWLAEIKDFLPENIYTYNVPIATLWKTKEGNTRIIQNLLEGEYIGAKIFMDMMKEGRKKFKGFYKRWKPLTLFQDIEATILVRIFKRFFDKGKRFEYLHDKLKFANKRLDSRT